jgi:hypothetical protein
MTAAQVSGLLCDRIWLGSVGLQPVRLCWIDSHFPNATLAVDFVGFRAPIGDVESAVGSASHTHWPEGRMTSDQSFPMRYEAGAVPMERVVIDGSIRPRGDHDAATEFDNTTRAFATRGDHPEGSSQFTVPRYEGMDRCAAVDVLKTVVRSFDHMEQSTGRSITGIVIGRQDDSIITHMQTERVPKSKGDAA